MKENHKLSMRMLVIMLLDVLCIIACGGVALITRFDFSFAAVPLGYKTMLVRFLCLQVVVTIVIYWLRKMYHYIWRSVSIYDAADMILSTVLAFLISYVAGLLLGLRLPVSVAFIDLLCLTVTSVGMRCFLRFYNVLARAKEHGKGGEERVMLIGAGEAGRLLLREIQSNKKATGRVRCIVDDNPGKWGRHMDGVPICGGRDRIGELVQREKITQIIFAIPAATPAERRDILEICQKTNCKIRTLPGIYEMVNDDVSMADVKDVQVEDLLGREPVALDTRAIGAFLRNKVILVTGGGGSIGSELCRQIAKYSPRRLIVLDIYENNAYDLQQELKRTFPKLDLQVEIASVRDKERTYAIFDSHRPHVVFHAAAHKHVPLMEACPDEAVKNNIFGTYHVVRAAEKYGTEKFVMISTDKAVNPTNFMGATKRFCEMILQSRNRSTTEFCAVRFGNVLGSNGSVVPLFKRQIESGGPVTLTDKRIIRYFMTIPEASQLVLEAGALAQRGQIFVLDMGEPVKILDLAENLIRLSGLEPYKDIEIKEIGLRPGEKLYEELLVNSDRLIKTANDKIFVEREESIAPAWIMAGLERLDDAVTGNIPQEELILLMKELVTTYHAPEEVNCAVMEAREQPDEEASEIRFRSACLQGVGELF